MWLPRCRLNDQPARSNALRACLPERTGNFGILDCYKVDLTLKIAPLKLILLNLNPSFSGFL